MSLSRKEFEGILDRIRQGDTLIKAVNGDNAKRQQFYLAMLRDKSEGLEDLYYEAQKQRADFLFDEVLEIADTELDPQRARVRIDARRWLASKLNPAKYGEKLDVNLNQTVDIGVALAEALGRATHARRVQELDQVVIPGSARALADEEDPFG